MKNLLTAMLNKDPEKRIRPNGVLNHPAIKSREKHFEELYMKDIEN
jgi:serine/threonine protein kinase